MAEPIGALRAELSVSSARFEADMKAAKEAVHQSVQGMQRSLYGLKRSFDGTINTMSSLRKYAAAAAGVMAAGGFAMMIKGSADMADRMAKLSQTTGLSVDSLATFSHAAELSGTSMDAFTNALRPTAKNIADMAMGTGEAKAAFQALDIDVKKADGSLKSTDQVILEVADKFKMMEDGTGKTALAMRLFGESGGALIPMLNKGADGIRAMQQEARDLGMVMDGDTAAAAEHFNDNLSRLNLVKKAFALQITQAVLPTLEKLTNSMVTGAKETGNLAEKAEYVNTALKLLLTTGTLLKVVFESVGKYIGGASAALFSFITGDFKGAVNIIKMTAGDLKNNLIQGKEDIVNIWKETGDEIAKTAPETGKKIAAPIMEAEKKVTDAGAKIKEAIDRQIQALQDQAATFGMTEKETTLYRLAVQGASAAQLALADSILNQVAAQKEQQGLMEAGKKVFEDTRTPLERYNVEMENLNALLAAGAINMDTFQRASVQAKAALDAIMEKNIDSRLSDFFGDIDKQEAAIKDSTSEMTEFQVQAYRNMQTAMSDFLFDPFENGIKGMAQGFADTIRRMMSELLAAQFMKALFGEGFGGGGNVGGFVGSLLGMVAHGGMSPAGAMPVRGIPRFHSGLAADEFPAILQRGERVVSREGVNDERASLNSIAAAIGKMQGGGSNVRIINSIDPGVINDWAASSAGEKVIMNVIRRNPGQIRQAVG